MDVKIKKIIEKIDENLIAIILVALAISTRLLPHPDNFTAVGASALFAGVYLRKKYTLWLPLIIMIISDAIIGFHNLIFFTWGSFVLIGVIGLWIRKNKNILNVIFGTVTGSLTFFFITNFAVWAFTPMYAKTSAGLMQCFIMGLSFFRNTIMGDLFYVGVLFGVYETMRYMLPKLQQKTAVSSVSSK